MRWTQQGRSARTPNAVYHIINLPAEDAYRLIWREPAGTRWTTAGDGDEIDELQEFAERFDRTVK